MSYRVCSGCGANTNVTAVECPHECCKEKPLFCHNCGQILKEEDDEDSD